MSEEREEMRPYARDCGRSLKFARLRAGHTQASLAKLFEIPQSTVSRWERGDRLPRDHWRKKVSEALGVETASIWPPPRTGG